MGKGNFKLKNIMKKIKSVTLAKDFASFVAGRTVSTYEDSPDLFTLYSGNGIKIELNRGFIESNKDIFNVQYEDEYFEPSDLELEKAIDKWEYKKCILYCNALRAKCDEANEEIDDFILYYNENENTFGIEYNFEDSKQLGLKFNSRQSAEQFLKLCKPDMLELLKELYKEKDLV